MPFILSV